MSSPPSSSEIAITFPDPVWDEIVDVWKTYFPPCCHLTERPGLHQKDNLKRIMDGACMIRLNKNGCLRCKLISLYLVFQYVGKCPELLAIEPFRQKVNSKLDEFQQEENIFFGHLVGTPQESNTTFEELAEKSCTCQLKDLF
jgi:hypothetical protein